MIDEEVRRAAARVLDLCRARSLTVVTAESCTGGLVAAALTEIPGSSDVVDCGFIAYSNEAKQLLLKVPAATLAEHGAVSRATAQAMAQGALAQSGADLAVAVTGIAGPGGGSPDKPVGLVHFAATRDGKLLHREMRFGDIGRAEVRNRSVGVALDLLTELAE